MSSPITSPQSLKTSPRPLPSAALHHHRKACFSLLNPAALPFYFFSFLLTSSPLTQHFILWISCIARPKSFSACHSSFPLNSKEAVWKTQGSALWRVGGQVRAVNTCMPVLSVPSLVWDPEQVGTSGGCIFQEPAPSSTTETLQKHQADFLISLQKILQGLPIALEIKSDYPLTGPYVLCPLTLLLLLFTESVSHPPPRFACLGDSIPMGSCPGRSSINSPDREGLFSWVPITHNTSS